MAFPRHIPCESIMDSIADGVFTVDLDWTVTSFNRAAAEITGVAPKEALGRKCWEVFHSSICDGECALKECMKSGGSLTNKSIFILRPGGEKVPVSISASPLKDRRGRTIGGVETFRDVSAIQLMRKKIEGLYSLEDIVTRSQALIRTLAILPQIAASESSALILGESGTGKELFARAIHSLSPRKKGPFIAVNCGALPESLMESELFGCKAGAFTDAKRDRQGRFQLARGGTIFLDEIGDLPLLLQVKILRVLQEKRFEPLGAEKSEKADVRVVAATNRDLEAMVAKGEFRQDLYYRLNVARLRLPPLRERPEDVPLLVSHFISRQNLLQGKEVAGLSEDAMHILLRHDWPGNVRELENIIEYAFILCSKGFIQVEHLPEHLQAAASPGGARGAMTMVEIKRQAAVDAVRRNGGRKMAACRELGVTKDTLRRILAAQGE